MSCDLVFRTGYDFNFGERADLDFGDEPSLTIQSAKDECDINLIIDRAQRGMQPSFVNEGVPQFGDFSDVSDYQSAFNQVLAAQEQFEQLPSSVRERFQNDPAKLFEFLGSEANYDEAVKLGLVQPKPDVVVAEGNGSPQGGDAVSAAGVVSGTPSA